MGNNGIGTHVEVMVNTPVIELDTRGARPPFKTKELGEKARQKYPERERKAIGLGVTRIESSRN